MYVILVSSNPQTKSLRSVCLSLKLKLSGQNFSDADTFPGHILILDGPMWIISEPQLVFQFLGHVQPETICLMTLPRDLYFIVILQNSQGRWGKGNHLSLAWKFLAHTILLLPHNGPYGRDLALPVPKHAWGFRTGASQSHFYTDV